jgi:hypothetical protein
MGEQGKKAVGKHYSIQKMAGNIVRIYQKVYNM